MKRVGLILFTLIIIMACNNYTKVKNINRDSTKIYTNTPDTQKANLTVQTQSALKDKSIFVDVEDPQHFFYIIDNQYCLESNKICRYSYNSNNQILTLFIDGIDSNFNNGALYYQVYSGSNFKDLIPQLLLNDPSNAMENIYHISSNLNNSSFALVGVEMISAEKFQIDRNIGVQNKTIGLNRPMDDISNKYISSTIFSLTNNLKISLQNSEYLYLKTENKVDVIKGLGKEKVDSILTNKVDDTYNSLITKWEKINTEKNTIENFLNSYQQNNTNFSEIFSKIINSKLSFKQLDEDYDEYNKKLDNEILPIIHSSSEPN